jgi:hypothetical protein
MVENDKNQHDITQHNIVPCQLNEMLKMLGLWNYAFWYCAKQKIVHTKTSWFIFHNNNWDFISFIYSETLSQTLWQITKILQILKTYP